MDETGAYCTEGSKSERETPIEKLSSVPSLSRVRLFATPWIAAHQASLPFILTHICGILKDGNDEPICKTARETQKLRTDCWTLWEKARVGRFERIALKHVYYHT